MQPNYVVKYQAPANYQPTYYPPAFKVDPAYFAQATAAYIREKAAASVLAQSERDVARKIEQLEAKLTPLLLLAPHPAEPADLPAATPPPPEPGDTEPAPPAAKPSLVSVLSRNRCDKCHTGDASSGDLKLFESKGVLATLDLGTLKKIYTRTDSTKPKSMPPKGDRVSPADRKVIAEAVRDGVKSAKAAIGAIEAALEP